MYSATTTGTGSAQGHPRNIYRRSASDSSSAAMYTQRGTRASLKRHLSLLHQLPVAAAQRDRTTLDVVDRWVNARPSQLALNRGQQRVRVVLYRSNHRALSHRDRSARPVHHLGVNNRWNHGKTLSTRTAPRATRVSRWCFIVAATRSGQTVSLVSRTASRAATRLRGALS